MEGPARWIALAWRLPTGSSTPRVSVWRTLKRLGAATLTPGAALVPFREDLLEQLGWVAQEVEESGGDAWVLPVTELSEREELRVRRQVTADIEAQYRQLAADAAELAARAASEMPSKRELTALRRRFERIRSRDHYGAQARAAAAKAVQACLACSSPGAISGELLTRALRHQAAHTRR